MIDDQLPPDARALLAAGRDRMGPDAATVARLRARVGAAVIAAAPASASAASATPAASAAPTAATTTAAVAAKSVAVKLVVLATVGTSAYVAHDQITKPRPVDATIAPSIAPHETTSDETEVQPSIAISAPVVVDEPPAPVVVDEPPAREAPAPVVPPRKEPAATHEPAGATLTREIELVDRATIALRGSDFAAALDALRTYDSETAGAGQLAQDAAALHVEALCRTHDFDATRELAAFDKRWPRSAQRSHLTSVCTEVTK